MISFVEYYYEKSDILILFFNLFAGKCCCFDSALSLRIAQKMVQVFILNSFSSNVLLSLSISALSFLHPVYYDKQNFTISYLFVKLAFYFRSIYSSQFEIEFRETEVGRSCVLKIKI